MTQLAGQRARLAAEPRVVLVVAEPGLHNQRALGQERIVRAAGRDVDTCERERERGGKVWVNHACGNVFTCFH